MLPQQRDQACVPLALDAALKCLAAAERLRILAERRLYSVFAHTVSRSARTASATAAVGQSVCAAKALSVAIVGVRVAAPPSTASAF